MTTTETPKLTAGQRQAHKQAVAERLATLQESFIRPRKTPPRRFDKYRTDPDWRDPACSPGLVVGLARLAVERALHLSSADSCMALILAHTQGGIATNGETGEEISEATATPLQVKASRRLLRAERLLLRLVTASATRTLAGEVVVIGARRRTPRKPHWSKRSLTA